MIYPTEMTLATGTTVYAGDPQSDERIVSREVRVSVTYRIEEDGDFDLADFACMKAPEVERARVAAMERIQERIQEGSEERIEERNTRDRRVLREAPFDPGDSSFDASDPHLEPPDENNDEYGAAPDPFPEEADYLHAHCSQASNGGRPGNGEHARNGGFPRPPASPAAPRMTEAHHVTEEETDWATRPQVLALGSHFKRLGLSSENQTALLRARFGKFRPERLTKAEAVGLMRCLERNEWDSAEVSAP